MYSTHQHNHHRGKYLTVIITIVCRRVVQEADEVAWTKGRQADRDVCLTRRCVRTPTGCRLQRVCHNGLVASPRPSPDVRRRTGRRLRRRVHLQLARPHARARAQVSERSRLRRSVIDMYTHQPLPACEHISAASPSIGATDIRKSASQLRFDWCFKCLGRSSGAIDRPRFLPINQCMKFSIRYHV